MNIETANRLYTLRKKHNLSQEELAEKIGVSRQAVSKWERAEASPDTDNMVALSQIYGVSLDELLIGSKQGGEDAVQSEEKESVQDEPEDTEPDGAESEEIPEKDKVSFKNGIHIHSKDGDKVDIGFGGVHVVDKDGSKVHVDMHGVTVIDKDDNGCDPKSFEHHHEHKDKSVWYAFPYPVLVVIAFLLWGFFGGWAISWILFLTIPLYYSLIDAVHKRKPWHFAYPVLVVAAYLAIGMILHIWHPTWILFLTVPVFYWFCDIFKKKQS